jgi:hypothetical protein
MTWPSVRKVDSVGCMSVKNNFLLFHILIFGMSEKLMAVGLLVTAENTFI